ncbi:MAG: PAS domain S-box protein [Bacteroidota bacterium]
MILACIVVLLSATAGYIYYLNEEATLKENIGNELSAIAEMKTTLLTRWYHEEIADAALIAHDIDDENFRGCLKDGNAEDCQRLERTITSIKSQHGYSDLLFASSDGLEVPLLGFSEPPPDSMAAACVRRAIQTSSVIVSGFKSLPGHETFHIDFIAPMATLDAAGGLALLLRVEPVSILVEILRPQALSDHVLTTTFVHMHDGDASIVSEFADGSQKLWLSELSNIDTTLIPVRAMNGYRGIIEGQDLAGHEVVAYIAGIDGTPWCIIVKTDRSAAFEDLIFEVWLIAIFVLLIIGITISGLAFIYSYRQRNTYRELWKAEEEFRITLYSIADAVITTDESGAIRYLNTSAEALMGCEERLARGMALDTLLALHLESTGEKIEDPVSKTLRERKPLELSNGVVVQHTDGRQIPVMISASVLLAEAGRIAGVVLVLRDQTEARVRQRLLEESERKYRSLFDATAEAIALYDVVVDGNSELVDLQQVESNRMFGVFFRLQEEAAPDPKNQFLPDSLRTTLLPLCRKVLASSVPIISDLYIESIDRHCIITVYSPEKHRIAVVYHDITNRKKAEEALQLKMAELERFHRLTVDRELQMIELKAEINALLEERGGVGKYRIV